MSSVFSALVEIQAELKAPKDQSAGRYSYRNIEDINEQVKPLARKHGCAVVYSDEFNDGICVSTCSLVNEDGAVAATGCSYINKQPKNMSIEQASGAASSYARKYAACGLFAIDSSESDPDRTNADDQEKGRAKQNLWANIKRYAELQGRDPQEVLDETMKRADWEDSVDCYQRLSVEFEEGCKCQ